jgi:hypothetical protein
MEAEHQGVVLRLADGTFELPLEPWETALCALPAAVTDVALHAEGVPVRTLPEAVEDGAVQLCARARALLADASQRTSPLFAQHEKVFVIY